MLQPSGTRLGAGKTPDDEALWSPLLDRFARWSELRAALQVPTFTVTLWGVVVAR